MSKLIPGMAIAAMLLLTADANAVEILGYQGGPEAVPSAGQRANFKRGSKFTLATNGFLKSLCAKLDGSGGSSARSQLFSIVLYRDDNGLPGTKVVESPATQWLNTSVTGPITGSYCSSMSHVPLTPGDYWIMLHTGGTAGVIRYYSGPAANWYGNPDTFSDGASDPFGTGGGPGNGTVSVYAEYLTPAELPSAGRTTVGANPSAGLRSQFKRGSPVDVTVTGEPESITAYLDGLGGNTGVQDITVALYRDSNGVPGELVVASSPRTVPAGFAPGWYTIGLPRFPHIAIAPGRYWIMLHTGEDTGIIRYYADGAGNWYGNADTYSDGPSNPFGPGGTGNGRISAFVSIDQTP